MMGTRRPMTRTPSGNGRYYDSHGSSNGSTSDSEDSNGSVYNPRADSRSYLLNVRPENRTTFCNIISQLTEETQPCFETTLKARAVSEGSDAKFICMLSGYPEPEVTWYKDDEEMDRYCGLPKYEIFHNGKRHTLQIYKCSEEDAAIYQASARNNKGIVSCSGVLEVGTMTEYKIHQRWFAKLKRKAEAKMREIEQSRRRVKENFEEGERLRALSPERIQRKRRFSSERKEDALASSEDKEELIKVHIPDPNSRLQGEIPKTVEQPQNVVNGFAEMDTKPKEEVTTNGYSLPENIEENGKEFLAYVYETVEVITKKQASKESYARKKKKEDEPLPIPDSKKEKATQENPNKVEGISPATRRSRFGKDTSKSPVDEKMEVEISPVTTNKRFAASTAPNKTGKSVVAKDTMKLKDGLVCHSRADESSIPKPVNLQTKGDIMFSLKDMYFDDLTQHTNEEKSPPTFLKDQKTKGDMQTPSVTHAKPSIEGQNKEMPKAAPRRSKEQRELSAGRRTSPKPSIKSETPTPGRVSNICQTLPEVRLKSERPKLPAVERNRDSNVSVPVSHFTEQKVKEIKLTDQVYPVKVPDKVSSDVTSAHGNKSISTNIEEVGRKPHEEQPVENNRMSPVDSNEEKTRTETLQKLQNLEVEYMALQKAYALLQQELELSQNAEEMRAEAQKAEAKKAEEQRAEAQKAEVQRAEAIKTETMKAKAQNVEAQRVGKMKENVKRAEPQTAETKKAEAQKAEAIKAEAQKAEAHRVGAMKEKTQRTDALKSEAHKTDAQRTKAMKEEAQKSDTMKAGAQKGETTIAEAQKAELMKAVGHKVEIQRAQVIKAEAQRPETHEAEIQKTEAQKADTQKAQRADTQSTMVRKAKPQKAEATKAEAQRVGTNNQKAQKEDAQKEEAQWVGAMKLKAQEAEAQKAETQKSVAQREEEIKKDTQREKEMNIEEQKAELQKAEGQKAVAQRAEVQKADTQMTKAMKVETQKAEEMRAKAQKEETHRVGPMKAKTQRAETQKSEAQKAEAPKTDAQRNNVMKAEAQKAEAVKPEEQREEAMMAEEQRAKVVNVEVQKVEAQRAQVMKAEAQRAEARKAETQKSEVKKAETPKSEAQRAEEMKEETQRGREMKAQKAGAQIADAQRTKAMNAEAQKAEAMKAKTQREEAQRAGPLKADSQKAEVQKTDAQRTKAMKAQAQTSEAIKAEAQRTEVLKAEVQKAETQRTQVVKAEANKGETQKSEAEREEEMKKETKREKEMNIEEQKAELQKAEGQKAKAQKAEVQKADAQQTKAMKAESQKEETQRVGPMKAKTQRAETQKAEVQKVETQKAEVKAETPKEEAQRAEEMKEETQREKELKAQNAEAQKAEAMKAETQKEEAHRVVPLKAKAQRAEAQKTDEQMTNAKKAEARKAEAVKAEEQREEAIMTEAQMTVVLKAEVQKAETQRAQVMKAETLSTETQNSETQKARAKKAETPKSEAQRAEEMKGEAQMTETQKAEQQKAETQKAEAQRAEVQETDIQRTEAMKAEAQKEEAQRVGSMKVKAQRAEAQKPEEQKAQAQKRDAQRTKAMKAETQKAEAMKAEAQRDEAIMAQSQRAEIMKSEVQKAETQRAQAMKPEAQRTETQKAETQKSEAKNSETQKPKAQRAEEVKEETQREKEIKAEAQMAEAMEVETQKAEAQTTQSEKAKAQKAKIHGPSEYMESPVVKLTESTETKVTKAQEIMEEKATLKCPSSPEPMHTETEEFTKPEETSALSTVTQDEQQEVLTKAVCQQKDINEKMKSESDVHLNEKQVVESDKGPQNVTVLPTEKSIGLSETAGTWSNEVEMIEEEEKKLKAQQLLAGTSGGSSTATTNITEQINKTSKLPTQEHVAETAENVQDANPPADSSTKLLPHDQNQSVVTLLRDVKKALDSAVTTKEETSVDPISLKVPEQAEDHYKEDLMQPLQQNARHDKESEQLVTKSSTFKEKVPKTDLPSSEPLSLHLEQELVQENASKHQNKPDHSLVTTLKNSLLMLFHMKTTDTEEHKVETKSQRNLAESHQELSGDIYSPERSPPSSQNVYESSKESESPQSPESMHSAASTSGKLTPSSEEDMVHSADSLPTSPTIPRRISDFSRKGEIAQVESAPLSPATPKRSSKGIREETFLTKEDLSFSPSTSRKIAAKIASGSNSIAALSVPSIVVGSLCSEKTPGDMLYESQRDSNRKWRSSENLSAIPSATPQELASGARRKIYLPMPKQLDDENDGNKGSLTPPSKKESPNVSPGLSRKSSSLLVSQSPPVERRSPGTTRRMPMLDVPKICEETEDEKKSTDSSSQETKDSSVLLKEEPQITEIKKVKDPYKAPQVIRKIRAEQFSDASGNLKLWCQFFNILSDSDITWYKDEVQVAKVKRCSGDEGQVALAIVQASVKDCGVYQCTIENEYGTDSTDCLLSAEILAGFISREEAEVGEEIEMTPMVFAKGLADSGYWGDKFFGRIAMEESHAGKGFSRKSCRVKVIYGLEPMFESGKTCIIKIRNLITFGTKNENTLVEKNYDITIQECKIQNTTREYCKIFAAECRGVPNFGQILEILPLNLIYRPANNIPYATIEDDLQGAFEKYCVRDITGKLHFKNSSEIEQKCCTFQHWVYQWTNGNFLVTTLEGVEWKLTNIAISTKSRGYQGLKESCYPEILEEFPSIHQCNNYCEMLSLKSLKTMESLQPPAKPKGSRSPQMQRKSGSGSAQSSPQIQKKTLTAPQNNKKGGVSPKSPRKSTETGEPQPGAKNKGNDMKLQ